MTLPSACTRAVAKTAELLGLKDGGYRLVANNGSDARQDVQHFHVHIFGGRLGGVPPQARA